MLNIEKRIEDGAMLVALEGQLDTDSAPRLDAAMLEELADVQRLELDLAKLDYISSAGLRVLLRAKKIMGERPCHPERSAERAEPKDPPNIDDGKEVMR